MPEFDHSNRSREEYARQNDNAIKQWHIDVDARISAGEAGRSYDIYRKRVEGLDASQEQAVPPTSHELAADDQRLVAAVQRKDRKATAEFVSRYSDAVYRYVHSRLIPRTDQVDDLVQEVFLAAWENLSKYRGTSSLGAWLMGIARHKVADYYRSCLREPGPAGPTEEQPGIEAITPDLDRVLDTELLQKKTWEALTRLQEKYRVVLLWRYWDKCSAREMAVRSGKTEKAIERLLARAREEFRRMWTHE